MNTRFLSLKVIFLIAFVAAGAVAGFVTRNHWKPWLPGHKSDAPSESTAEAPEVTTPTGKVLLSDQAIKNLGLKTQSMQPTAYPKTIQIPGMVVDRPGRSDRNIVSPLTGVVTRVHALPGDTVKPGAMLFSIRLLSESMHQTQSDLFKAAEELKLAEAQLSRLEKTRNSIPEARIIEAQSQITRWQVSIKAHRRELSNRGLTSEQIDRAAEGNFIRETTITVPAKSVDDAIRTPDAASETPDPVFEMQELKVDLGQQVQAGQTLSVLANHRLLFIEGRAFRDETPLLEKSVREAWPVEVDFQEDAGADWPPLKQTFHIRRLANTIDPVNRTFAFQIPLENESRVVEQKGRTQMLWRFRPGQRLRLQVRIEELKNVFVLPSDAVVREGADAFVFTQNVNTFERKPVTVAYQDRRNAILNNDGSLIPGSFVVQSGAAQLNRMIKSQSNSVPKGYHVHADGSLHKNEDEGK